MIETNTSPAVIQSSFLVETIGQQDCSEIALLLLGNKNVSAILAHKLFFSCISIDFGLYLEK